MEDQEEISQEVIDKAIKEYLANRKNSNTKPEISNCNQSTPIKQEIKNNETTRLARLTTTLTPKSDEKVINGIIKLKKKIKVMLRFGI